MSFYTTRIKFKFETKHYENIQKVYFNILRYCNNDKFYSHMHNVNTKTTFVGIPCDKGFAYKEMNDLYIVKLYYIVYICYNDNTNYFDYLVNYIQSRIIEKFNKYDLKKIEV